MKRLIIKKSSLFYFLLYLFILIPFFKVPYFTATIPSISGFYKVHAIISFCSTIILLIKNDFSKFYL